MLKWTKEIFDRVIELYEDHTYEDISKILKKEFNFKKTPNAIRKAFKRYNKDETVLSPKILIYDIETAPMLGYVWSLWDNNVSLSQLHTDWYILSWSAKWLHEDKVMYKDQRNAKNIEDDSDLLTDMWKLLDEADIVVTQNGKSFDEKRLNARFLINGFDPPSSYRHIDTKQIAKKFFGFTSNKLEYMTNKLCTKYKKLDHAKFSGFRLWKECLNGNKEAWNEMELYNKYDVLSLEELYKIVISWDNSININVYNDSLDTTCTCGSKSFKKSGFAYTNTGKFQRYKCTKCGKEHKDKTNLLSKEKRKSLKK